MRRFLLALLALSLASGQAVLLVQPAYAAAAPTVSAPADGTTTTDRTPLLEGTWDPSEGGGLSVQLDGTEVFSDNAGIPGGEPQRAWQFQVPDDLALGQHTVEAIFQLSDNDPMSTDATFTIGQPGPAAPLLFGPEDNARLGNPVLATGVIADGGTVPASVRVFVDGRYLGEAALDGAEWRLTLPNLSNGDHTVYAVARDDADNDSDPSNSRTFTVDATAPAAPVIRFPENGYYENQNVIFRGTAEPGARLTIIYEYGTFTLTVPQSGEWEQDAQSLELGEGLHTFSVRQTDEVGNQSPPSDEVTYTYDATAPAAPAITLPTNGDTVSDGTFFVQGRGEIAATVTVFVDGQPVGTTVVDSDEDWRLNGVSTPPNGYHEITATQADRADNGSTVSNTVTIGVEVVDTAPAAPVVTAPDNGAFVNGYETVTVRGTGQPGATVTLQFDDGDPQTMNREETVGVDGLGNWALTTDPVLAEGSYILTAVQTDAGGSSTASTPRTLTVDTTPPAEPVVTAPTNGATVSQRARFSGTGEPGARIYVNLTQDNYGATVVLPDGTWSLLTDPLPVGPVSLSVQQVDPALNASESSVLLDLIVEATAPADPVIEDPEDGDAFTVRRPTFSGTGEPGATIVVRGGQTTEAPAILGSLVLAAAAPGVVLATGLVDGSGDWSATPTTDLALGFYQVVAEQSRDGVELGASDAVVFAIVTQPVITSPNDGSVVDAGFEVCGTGMPGFTIQVLAIGEIFDDGLAGYAETEVGEDGRWCVDILVTDEGSVPLAAVQTTGDGDFFAVSELITVTVDGGNSDGGDDDNSDDDADGDSDDDDSDTSLAATGGPTAVAGLVGLVLTGLGGLTLHLSRRRSGSRRA